MRYGGSIVWEKIDLTKMMKTKLIITCSAVYKKHNNKQTTSNFTSKGKTDNKFFSVSWFQKILRKKKNYGWNCGWETFGLMKGEQFEQLWHIVRECDKFLKIEKMDCLFDLS